MTARPRIRTVVIPWDQWFAERALLNLSPDARAAVLARVPVPTASNRQALVARLVLDLADRLDPRRERSANACATHITELHRAFASQATVHARRGTTPNVEPEQTLHAIRGAWGGYRGEDGIKSAFPSARTIREILAGR